MSLALEHPVTSVQCPWLNYLAIRVQSTAPTRPLFPHPSPFSSMPTSQPSESPNELPTASVPESPKKKGKGIIPSLINPAQYQAIRYVSFMSEDSKNEVSPAEFVTEALSRHLAYYHKKRLVEFPPKMYQELLNLNPGNHRLEE